jgi:hypothetical protein
MTKVYCRDCKHVRSCSYEHYCRSKEGTPYTSPETYYEPGTTTLVHLMRKCEIQNRNHDCKDFEIVEAHRCKELSMNSVVGRYVDEVLYKKPWYKRIFGL